MQRSSVQAAAAVQLWMPQVLELAGLDVVMIIDTLTAQCAELPQASQQNSCH
jgi:hypothetical protein